MALARLALKNMQQRLGSASSAPSLCRANQIRHGWNSSDEAMVMNRRFLSTATEKASDDKEVAVSEKGDGRKSRLFPRRNRRRSLWRRNDDADFVPALYEFFPSGLGNALMQATENINRLFDNMHISPGQLMGRVKEKDDHYKLRYEVPGLTKDDVKITVHDGILMIKGEHKREEEEGSDGEYWSAETYGYYNTSLTLPEDAKADEIKAELKDGVLTIVIPRTERPKKDAKEVKVQ
ncbi:26.5 kDa heat shock protein, mitochondrial [Syzygium oleosum]|uniref:26.5 kDa heat shock protein, mitochondrial n=1 Tax=Syzygium oleosum TaxID=219896 RepID=UPI0011D212DA|nr:26.5 kDa heat shock protein, mitochondrial [Syzygium oleosum]